MSKPEAWERLGQFRNALYGDLGRRQDSLFELVDAVLTAPHRSTLVRLSLCSVFRRRWPSTCDALADGCIDVAALRQLFVRSLPATSSSLAERPVWVVDGTIWPRPAARATAERTWEYRPLPGWPQSGVVPAWAYQWLVVVAEPAGSWVLPLDVQRRGPTAASATQVALEQIAAVRAAQPQTPRPVVTLDSGYDLDALARAQVDADLVVRLKKSRIVYGEPASPAGRGRPRLHGQPFRLADERTHHQPQRSIQVLHPIHGRVQLDAWTGLHVAGAPEAPLSVVRIQLERLPNAKRPPQPLWLAWIGGPLPEDLTRLWYWYARRFTVEHAFRFFKQSLGWTTIRPRSAAAADRWSWLIAAACWQLWLARPLLTEVRLPWERPRPHGLITPGQLQRHFTGILVRISTPARAPHPRGKSPGRRPGQRPPPPIHYDIARRPRSPAA